MQTTLKNPSLNPSRKGRDFQAFKATWILENYHHLFVKKVLKFQGFLSLEISKKPEPKNSRDFISKNPTLNLNFYAIIAFMSKKESLKANIDTIRLMLGIGVTAILGMFGYAIVHIEDLTKTQMVLGLGALAFLFVVLALLAGNYLKKIKKLEKMK